MGQLLRILIIILGIGVILMALRQALPHHRDRRKKPADTAPRRMVQCVHCRVHVPESEVVFIGELAYCRQDHAKAGHGR